MSNFIDECIIYARGGDGGAGCISFRREAHTPRGGPDGGDGGDGGSVWICADTGVSSLIALTLRPHQRAQNGVHGKGKKKHGSKGGDCEIIVPVGTQVFSVESGEKLADLSEPGRRCLAVAGGEGGKGNARFLSNRRRAPSFAEQGELGIEKTLRLELKLLADVALVGFPNAGKSTLISRISAARPRIADYPFTTLEPNLGAVILPDGRDFVVADIPGLIEGAAEGKGLGHQFLRHIERAKVLAILLDLSAPDISPAEQLAVLLKEVGAYNPELLERPRILAGSKLDIANPDLSLPAELDVCISSVVGTGLSELTGLMAVAVEKENQKQELAADFSDPVLHRPLEERPGADITAEKIDRNCWRLVGRSIERAVALSDLTNPEAMLCAQERLLALGTDDILSRAGAQEGDMVLVGELEFEFYKGASLDYKTAGQ